MREFDLNSSEPRGMAYVVRLLGTGAAVPTKELGRGITVSRTAQGVIKLTWIDNPLTFCALVATFGAATPSAVKGYTLTRDTYDATTKTIEVSFWDSSFAAVDLAAAQYVDIVVIFREATA